MISFHHSFSTRIFLDEKSSPERAARRAQAVAALKAEARTPNELREFWWFLRSDRSDANAKMVGRTRPAGSSGLQNGGGHA
jgi:hypothetical protein